MIVDQCAQNNGTPKIGTYTQHARPPLRRTFKVEDRKMETRGGRNERSREADAKEQIEKKVLNITGEPLKKILRHLA